MKNSTYKLLIGAVLFTVAIAQPGVVSFAQAQQTLEIEEVIVTARKRQESVMDVPLAVTAFTPEDLKRRNIAELEDVARYTAGFTFEDFDGGNGSPVIRGQSQINVSGREQNVATFYDGVYLPRSWLVDLGTTNLERIEIVKGPQSSRYGRNAFAGAINYISKRPGDDFEAIVTASAGNDERFDAGVALSIPIVEDVFAIRASFDHTEYDGSWDNRHPFADAGFSPGTDGNIGGWDTDTYSLNAVFTPNERLTIDFGYYGFDREQETRAGNSLNTSFFQGNCGTNFSINFANPAGPNAPRLFCGEFGVPADDAETEPRGYARVSDGDIIRLGVDFEINDAVNVSYLYGNVEAIQEGLFSIEPDTINCGSIFGAPNGFPFSFCNWQSRLGDVDYDSHEVRVAFDNGGPFTASIGGFVADGTDELRYVSINIPSLAESGNVGPIIVSPISSIFPDFSNFVLEDATTTSDIEAIFGEIGYAFSDKTRASFEVRYTSEEIITVNNATGVELGDTFKFTTPRITVEHDLNDDVLLYASAARGAKAGGFNPGGIQPESRVFDPEFNWTYELGAKNRIFGGRGVANVAVFLSKWTDQQINAIDPDGGILSTTIIRNLGNATSWGVEFEGAFQATENVSLDGTVAYVDSTFDSGTIDQRYASFGGSILGPPCDNVVCSASGNVGGNELERAPNWQLAFGAQWEAQIPSWSAEYYIRGDVAYQSDQYAESVNISTAPSRTIVNASAGLDFEGLGGFKSVELSAWVRNLTDKRYVSNNFQILQNAGSNIYNSFYGERRALGLTVTARY